MLNLIGNEKKLELVQKIASSSRARGSYIFAGPEGAGKMRLAGYFADLLTGSSALDYYHVAPEIKEVKKRKREQDIKVSAIRDAIRFMSLLPSGKGYRVCLIEKAEKMTEEAQNALLKSLEEPGERSVYILVVDSEQKLLPTIGSRSVTLRLGLVHPSRIYSYLKENGRPEKQAHEATLFGWGRLKKSEELADDEERFTQAVEMKKELITLLSSPLYVRLNMIDESNSDPVGLSVKISSWISMLAAHLESMSDDSLRDFHDGGQLPCNAEETARYLLELIKLRTKLRRSNASPRLALEAALITLT